MIIRSAWRGWRYLRRSAPVAVVIVAVSMFVLDVTDRLTTHAFERLLVLAIGLLAVDALVERIDLLEKMESRVSELPLLLASIADGLDPLSEIRSGVAKLTRPAGLSNRSTFNADVEFAAAREIDIAGITLVNVLLDKRGLFEKLLRDGSRLRLLLLSPTSNAWASWNEAVTNEDTDAHLKTSLGIIRGLAKLPSGRCEVRYAPHLLPTSLVIIDGSWPRGCLAAEIIFAGMSGYERPHVVLTRSDDQYWFEFMRNQFESLWDRSSVAEL